MGPARNAYGTQVFRRVASSKLAAQKCGADWPTVAIYRQKRARVRPCHDTESKLRVCPHLSSYFSTTRKRHVLRQSLPRQEHPRRLQCRDRNPDERRPDQVRSRQGDRGDVRRPLHVDGDALPLQLRLYPAHPFRRWGSRGCAGDKPGPADHQRGDQRQGREEQELPPVRPHPARDRPDAHHAPTPIPLVPTLHPVTGLPRSAAAPRPPAAGCRGR